ncbi:MAG: class IIb bacteriocin, lactobin A/cerein 7B family [Bacilli bacterium]|nr:class IIb bacteriocin, lactobin A/cerein 7B family [Bacilli bacterium]MDD4608272.1 class IIb bacteriocin, lactobin A/cerein 7B family [Bacilli bacterium]
MNELTKQELMQINGGGLGIGLLIGAGIVFLIGLIDGYVRPLKCHR